MTQSQDDYLHLLQKARGALPENVGNKERWALPEPDLIIEGRMTILRNFRDILTAMRRPEDHVTKFLVSQLGTSGAVDGDRMVFTGRVSEANLANRLDDYVGTYVQCSECGAPDTHLEKDGRVQLLKCEACGAHQPIKTRKARRPEALVKEGGEYTVTIKSKGQRGDGLAQYEGFTFFVPNVGIGQTIKVKVARLNGKIAFCHPA